MRKINTEDVFKMARLIKNGNIGQIISDAYAAGMKKDADSQQIGIKVVMDIMCSCTDAKVENQIYELIAGICEKKLEDIKTQSFETTIEDVKKIVKENNILSFFESASDLSEKFQS